MKKFNSSQIPHLVLDMLKWKGFGEYAMFPMARYFNGDIQCFNVVEDNHDFFKELKINMINCFFSIVWKSG